MTSVHVAKGWLNMTDEAKQVEVNQAIEYLREDACGSCIYNSFIGECTSVSDCYDRKIADLIESLSAELEQVERERDAAVKCAKEFAARINAGEELTACEYCDKEFGTCNCNCMKEFEWRGAKE